MLSALILLGLSFAPQIEPPLSVCSVVSQLSEYGGRRVAIRGEAVLTKEGTFLKDPRCTRGPKVGTLEWPPYISWAFPSQRTTLPPGYRFDRGTLLRFNEAIQKLRSESKKFTVIVTVTGFLATDPNPKVVRAGDGSLKLAGFGHLNEFPAEILIERIEDWAVTEDKQ